MSLNKYRILITGGGGFLGQNIVKALRTHPQFPQFHNAEISIFSRSPYPQLEKEYKVDSITGDIRDFSSVLGAVKGKNIIFLIFLNSYSYYP